MKIAIYGGAFNPVHVEHVNLALAAKRELGLDRVIVVPTNRSPHKCGSLEVRNSQRLEMCRAAFCGFPGFEVSDCEIKRGGVSYSYVTCRRFKKLYPQDELYFIMGADMLKTFDSWRMPEEILKCVTPVVCARENPLQLKEYLRAFTARFKSDVLTFGYVGAKISSSRARALAALGEDLTGCVPREAAKLIQQRSLYAIPQIRGVKQLLTEQRWRHTVGVAVFAAENARRMGVFEYDAIVAAALHDCAKYLGESSPLLSGFTCPNGVPQPVVHQYSGAYVAQTHFGVTDKTILNAIRYHTSGKENMTALEKLIFLADMLEEGRDFDGVEELRCEFLRDVNGCLYLALRRQLEYLQAQKKPVYPLTRRAYEYIKDELNL